MAEEKASKLQSRKFVVWLVWLLIVIVNLLIDTVIVIITKNISDQLLGLTEKVLSWFFAISMMYLGANVGQKIGYAVGDALSKQTSKTEG